MSSVQLTGQKRKRVDLPPPRKSFFDALSDDPLSIITRHISARPHIDNWQDFIDPPHLLAVLKSGDRLDGVARDVVTALGHFDIRSTKDPNLEAALLRELSPHVRTLRVLWDPTQDIPKYSFQSLKLSLRIVHFDIYIAGPSRKFPFNAALKACSASLRELHIIIHGPCGKNEIDPIGRQCPQLETLCIAAYEFQELEFSSLWPVIGKTLTKLRLRWLVHSFSTDIELVSGIAEHCHRLKDVRLDHPRQNWLYRQLGSQLKTIYFESYRCTPSPDEITETLRCCPNVEVHARLFYRHPIEEMLSALSSRLSTLTIRFGPSVRILELPMIREVNLGIPPCFNSFVKSLFCIPRPTLRKLSISCCETKEIFECVAKSAMRLEELRIHVLNLNASFHEKDFETLLRANPQLHNFRVKYTGVQDFNVIERFTVAQLKCLKECNQFIEFEIAGVENREPSTIIRNACMPFRYRRVVVTVGDVRYLPT